jgi:hypothetical protein
MISHPKKHMTVTRRRKLRTALLVSIAVLVSYGIIAYILLPLAWSHYEHQKELAKFPMFGIRQTRSHFVRVLKLLAVSSCAGGIEMPL